MKKFNEIREENEKTANKLQEESKDEKTNWIWDSNSSGNANSFKDWDEGVTMLRCRQNPLSWKLLALPVS